MVSYHFRMTCLDLVPIHPQPLNGFVRLATCSILFFPGSFSFPDQITSGVPHGSKQSYHILPPFWWHLTEIEEIETAHSDIVCPTVEASGQQDGDRPIWKPLFWCIGSCICSGLPTGASCLVSAERNGLLGTCPTAQWKKQGYHPLQVVFFWKNFGRKYPTNPISKPKYWRIHNFGFWFYQ